MPTATVTSKGQVTIPKPVRDALGLETGDRVCFTLREDGVVELVPGTVDVMSLFGILDPDVKGVTIDAMNEAVARGAAGP